MIDEYPSTDESDIDAFLEYAREKVAENDISYDTISFLDFEGLLQNCVADNFLDSNICGDEDSMTSEVSFSGYVNEGCDGGSRYNKSALLTKREIMSDSTYRRIKGNIARKKKVSLDNKKIQPVASPDTDTLTIADKNDTPLHSFENQIDFHAKSGKDSRMNFMTTLTKSKFLEGDDLRNSSIQSDSSDSILDDILPRQTRQRKHRRRTNNKKKLRGESINSVCVFENPKESTLRSDSTLKVKANLSEKSGVSGRSCSSTASNFFIDTTNSVLPSLVKKGIKYCDIPKIERILARMLKKVDTMNQKQIVLDQLLDTRPLQIDNSNITQRGMALVHKLRAERKMALQQAFLRFSRERQEDSKVPTKFALPNVVKNESSKVLKLSFSEQQVIVPRVTKQNLVHSPSSLSSFSSIEERNRFKNFVDKTKRTLSYSFHRHDKEGLLQKHVSDEFWMNSSYSSPDETSFVQKTSSPFGKMKFSRLKANSRYEELSTSSLSNDPWNDSGDYSIHMRSCDSNHPDENLMPSDDSEWSEMSFTSDPNRFAGFCTSYKSKRLPLIQCSEPKIFDDSFDEIILRSKPNLSGNSCSNRVGDESPTCVMDFVFKSPQQKEGMETANALAFVDEGEGNQAFTDKEGDSFMMKSPGEMLCTSPIYEPVFLSPSRFEI